MEARCGAHRREIYLEGREPKPTGSSRSRGRLEAFSDGVFAIAITLLVLDLSVPPGSGDDLLGSFLFQWPAYLANIVSFATIGAACVAHTAVTEYVDRTDFAFARVNLLRCWSFRF